VVPKKSKTSSGRDVEPAGIILWHKRADKKDTKTQKNEDNMDVYCESFFEASFLTEGDGWMFSLPALATTAGSARIVTLSSHSDVVGVEIVASALVVALPKELEFSENASVVCVRRLCTRRH
jgi:hypothetical protein